MTLNEGARKRAFFYLLVAVVLTALAGGLSESVFGNYYKEVYDADAAMRGFIEFPRELPGLITVVIISLMSFMGEIRLAILAQILAIIGVVLMGLITPPFAIMLVFLFMNSLGVHLYMPLKDSLGLKIIGSENTGKKFGIMNGVRTGAGFVAALIVFFGFRYGVFNFEGSVIHVFLIAALFFVAVLLILLKIRKMVGDPPINTGKGRFLFRREYKFFYILASLHGAHKQIALVFGPWVLIDILRRQADTLAALSMVGMFLGVFFIPLVGKLVDRFGVRRLMFAEGFSFIVVYVLFGLVSAGLMTFGLETDGGFIFPLVLVIIVYALFIIDRMTMQLGMVRVLYLKSIAKDESEISPTLSTGMSIDHAISIVCALMGGFAWEAWGPQYVFFIAAALSLGNVFVAIRLPKNAQLDR